MTEPEVQEIGGKGGHPTATKQYERRLFLAQMIPQGFPPSEIVKAVVDKFKVTERTAWKDWSSREEWIASLAGIKEEMDKVSSKLIASLQEAQRLAFHEAINGDNSGARIGALRTVGELVAKEATLRQSLGLLPTAPIRLEQKTDMRQALSIKMWLPDVEIRKLRGEDIFKDVVIVGNDRGAEGAGGGAVDSAPPASRPASLPPG